MDKKVIRSWCLYDFGNSAFAVLFTSMFSVFYKDHVVGGGDDGVWWWSVTTSASMAMVALSSPFLGGVADHAGVRKRMLVIYTAVGVVAVLGFTTLGEGAILAGFCIGALANFAFEGGIVYYNAYLPDIAPRSHHGRVSAWGFSVGYVGSLIALGLAAFLVMVLDDIRLVWVALAVQWAAFSIPAFRNLPADKKGGMGVFAAAQRGFRETKATLKAVMGMKNLRRFLLAYFFYIDGVNTVIVMAAVYASEELGFKTTELIALYAVVQIAALVGSMAMARTTDRRGPKWVVRMTLVWWIVVVLSAYLAKTKPVFWIVAVLAGIGLGSIQAASRAFMSHLIPKGREAELFGFYALCGKTGAILGPLLFGAIAKATQSQRPAIMCVAAFYVFGFFMLRGVELDGKGSGKGNV